MRKTIYLICCCILFIISCKPETGDKLPETELMERLLQTKPDSLAMILEEEIDPFLLSNAERADYGRWLTRTHLRQNRSLINDTLIKYSLVYYEKTNSPYLLETYRLAAHQSNALDNDSREQVRLLERASQLAMEKNDTTILQEINYQLTYLYSMSDKKDKLKELIPVVRKYGGKPLHFYAKLNLVTIYQSLNEIDSLLLYAKEGVDESIKVNNIPLLYRFSQYYIEGLNKKGRSREALSELKKLDGVLPDNASLQINYITTFIGLSQFDSARVHINKRKELIEKYRYIAYEESQVLSYILQTLNAISLAKQGKNISLFDLGLAPDKLMSYSRELLKADREHQFVQGRLLKENYELDIERAGLRLRLVLAIFSLLVLTAVIVLIYQRKLLKNQRHIQEAKEQLRLTTIQLTQNESIISRNEELIQTLSSQIDEGGELKEEIEHLNRDNELLKEKNGELEKVMEKFSGSLRQKDKEIESVAELSRQNARLQEREAFLSAQLVSYTEPLAGLSKKPRYIDEMLWPEVIHAVNQLYDGFSYRLHSDFPSLTDEDIRYCCLIKIRFSNSVIAMIMGISPSSVTKRKQRIKEKLVQQRPHEIKKDLPLEIFLWNY